ncbi:MAG: hypothetical protein ABW328_05045 [Ilumatobacteraceae bacterium]
MTTTTSSRTRRNTRSPRTRRTRRFLSAATAVAVSSITLLGLAEPAAAGYTSTAKLQVSNKRCITLTGHLAMGPYETHGYLNNGARLVLSMWGDDIGLTDDYLGAPGSVTQATGTVNGATLYASDRGIEYEWVTCDPPGSALFWLNEDTFNADEVYAHITIFDGDGGLLLYRDSNVVTGDFSF